MAQSETQEEVTTIENQSPQRVVKRTTTQAEPQAKGETPQKVFDKKKIIFRSNQIICWHHIFLLKVLSSILLQERLQQ